jgi:Na+-transporting NADH:ubiquinone oxidoreductase subunit A
MKRFKITKGHNLKLDGQPSDEIIIIKDPSIISFHPNSIKNIKTKLLVKEGDSVKIGTPLFYDKKNEKSLFVSTCSGTVKSIVFGPRRVVETIDIDNDGNNIKEDIDNKIDRENLLKSGLWTSIRQKPYSKIPHFKSSPKSIFISAMPTEPFAMNYEYLMGSIDNHIQSGINALRAIFDCEINFISSENSFLADLNNVNHFSFNDLHPAGNVGVHIHNIDPIKNSDDTRWYLSLQDLNRMGQFFDTGNHPKYKYVNVAGNATHNPAIRKVLIGTKIKDILGDIPSDVCLISGDVLSGKKTSGDASIGCHDEIISLIKIDNKRNFLGWLMPGFNKYSLTNLFFSKLINNKKSQLSTKKNGSVRTIIPMGNWDRVMPMNILSEYMVKSILAKDIDMMEKLGIYECSPEDFALCSFICQSKVEVSQIIEEGLDMMEKEG